MSGYFVFAKGEVVKRRRGRGKGGTYAREDILSVRNDSNGLRNPRASRSALRGDAHESHLIGALWCVAVTIISDPESVCDTWTRKDGIPGNQ